MERAEISGTLFEMLHKNSRGKITVCSKSEDGRFRSVYGSYGEVWLKRENSFFSINTFIGKRCVRNIFELKANFIELDVDKSVYRERQNAKECLYMDLMDNYIGSCVPEPSVIMDSGHGFWLFYIYDEVVIARKGSKVNTAMMRKYALIQRRLYEELQELGADAHDVARVCRNDGTINKKRGMKAETVRLIDTGEDRALWDMETLAFELTGRERAEVVRRRTGGKCRRMWKNNRAAVDKSRFEDIKRLFEIRGDIKVGYRDSYLFLYAYYAFRVYQGDKDRVYKEITALNESFSHPLNPGEVMCCMKGASSREYFYRTDTIIGMLAITEDEQEELRVLRSDRGKIVELERVRRQFESRRNALGHTKREQRKIDNAYLVHLYSEEGLSQSQIAERMNLSRGMVCRYMKMDKPLRNQTSLMRSIPSATISETAVY